jgi:glycosyltransferase involved in cell wall biosynthesis
MIYGVIGKLKRNTLLHLHGGSFGIQILERYPILRRLNKYFISKMGAVVVSGPSHVSTFSGYMHATKIYQIPNFAQEFMFVNSKVVKAKFSKKIDVLRLLYLSGLTEGKGYLNLLEAYEALCDEKKLSIQLDFAGKFDSSIELKRFVERIVHLPNVTYHGVVHDEIKSKLFADAHIFCLPTSYREGQPISIIEAYASGCVVLTTPQPGILDIFKPVENGFLISSDDSMLLKNILETSYLDFPKQMNIALRNSALAYTNFREIFYCDSLESILLKIGK